KADAGHEPIFTTIELGNTSNNYYVPYIFEGIRIEPGAGYHGITCYSCVGPRFKNLTITGQNLAAGYGIELEYGGDHNNDIRIEDSIIHTFKRGIHGYCSNLVIKGNEIYNIGEDHLVLASGLNSGYNILIENNHIHQTNKVDPEAHPDGIAFMALKNVILRNNIIHDLNASQGIFDHGGVGSGSKNVLIENNLMYDIAVTELQFNDPTTATENWTLRNNTIIGANLVQQVSLNSGINHNVYNNIFVCTYAALEGAVDYHDYNIYVKRYGSNFGDTEPHSYGYDWLGDWNSTHNAIEQELFVDPDNKNFRLKEGCRAINFGDPYNVHEEPNDLDGNPRIVGGRIDAGCYEYISGTSDTTPPSTPQNLSATPISEHQIDLSWDASIDTESGISHYNIYRDGKPIGQSSSTSYSDTGLNSNTRYCYEVSAVNGAGLESPRSNIVCERTLADTNPPSISSVVASKTSIVVTFNEPLDTTSAEQTSNYTINNGIYVTAASLDTDTVTLTTLAHTEGTTYTLTVENVQDTFGNPMAETSRDYVYEDGLVGHWKFDDGSGSSTVDSSGNNNTGTLINGPTWTTGKINGALSFDGVDDTVEIGTMNLNSGAGSITLWSYAASYAPTGQYLFGHASQPWANRIQLYTDDAEGYLDLGLGNSHSTHTRVHNFDTQRWYHIALTWDGSNYTVYVDSLAEATGTYSDLSTLETYADIGNNGNRSDRTEAFNGIIDEVRIYNRALNAAEILEIYGQAPPVDTNGPVISNIALSNITNSGVTISWDTDENSDSKVEYGLDPSYGNATDRDNTLVTSHSVVLTGLSSSTTYHFRVISADVSGNESISQDQNFTTSGVITYSIIASAGGGGTISPIGTTQVASGGSQTYTINAITGYDISDVVVDGSSVGAVSSYSFTNVKTNHTISATFVRIYTITATAGNGGQISPGGTTQVASGNSQAYTITADSGYKISDVLVDGSSVGVVTSYSFTNVTANHTIATSFVIDEIDVTAPTVTNLSPQADSIQAQLNTLITLDIIDSGDGVDANSVTININNNTVYSGNTDKYSSTYGECYRTGRKTNYTFIYQSKEKFNFDQIITVKVNASDLAGNSMDEHSYSFKTKMRAFGKNKKVNKNNNLSTDSAEFASIVNNNRPTTCSDSKGNIWATWHAGSANNKDIYINKLTAGSEVFGNNIKLTDNLADQRNPTIAIGSDDKLYIAWQDSRRGNWDIYMSTSADGVNWSAETRITDSNDNQYYPAIAVDSSNKVYVVWEDSRNGNQDIYIGASNNGFVSKTISQITSDLAYQGEPAIAVDPDNTVYVVWIDKRISGENNIYGAASNNGPWTNVAIVNNQNNQSNPAIAPEDVGSILHIVWVDDRLGDNDIFYDKTTGGLTPLNGNSIIDDTKGTDQQRPTIAVSGNTGNNLQVFVSWEDERNTDYDLYFAELGSGSGTNVFVGDDETNSGQIEPALGIDRDGDPYLVWTDSRNMNTDIYYAGSTSIEATALASGNISTSSTTTVETADGVSVAIPAGAYPCDIEITISEIKNPPTTSKEYLSLPYDFGPSGIEFDLPVTITIPYEVPATDYSVSAYWYNLLTATPSQQGITDIETIVISSTTYLRFKTTHFTQFFVGGSFGSSHVSVSGGGGGGGCSMSANSQASALELLLPYICLTVTMVILKLKDRRKSKTRNMT
ncbi:MAG: hypothetical protein GWN67_23055, partial [Phycisphaerae bacterium]|nr:hypothetical protein [Phycisphaerae bacterium]NIT59843.1 hypothetical protein [Fodinibius sp.]NIU11377.1 hypothetical protein [Phycisphaerae bacterium]NIU59154.1 hypothetical protein [Phycisphaerae bacterium]NIV14573.1 hypothetical protein [Fodinibius sp.]